MALARQKLGWHHPPFEIPKEIYHAWDAREKGEKRSRAGMRSLPPIKRLIRNWKSLPDGCGWFTEGLGENDSEIYQ
ncbi:hypothetical protein ACLK2F_13925 [Escherichia coli]